MQKLVLLSAITCFLTACSEQACDLTGQRYAQKMKEGTPLTEKDKACIQAGWIRESEETMKNSKADSEKRRAEEKAHSSKPINWNETLFPKKQEAGGK